MSHCTGFLFSFFSKKVKVSRIFLFRINIYFFRIYTECCPIISPMLWRFQLPQHLLSSMQRLLPGNTFCFALDKLDTYLLLYFLPAHYVFEGKGALNPPHPPSHSPQKRCVYIVLEDFSKYFVQNLTFFWNF